MNDPATARNRHGFTAIELMVVLSVMALLATMAMPSLLGALRRGRINDAANAIVQVGSQARRLARQHPGGSDYYGVVVVNDTTPAYVALTYGPTATPADILMEAGQPVSKVVFSPNVVVYDGNAPLATSRSWLCQYGTGQPVQTASASAAPISILGLSLRSLDDRMRAALALYSIGQVHVASL